MKKPQELNSACLQILAAIQLADPYPPSWRELMQVTKYKNMNSISVKATRMRKLGLLDWEPFKKRTLHLKCHLEMLPDCACNGQA